MGQPLPPAPGPASGSPSATVGGGPDATRRRVPWDWTDELIVYPLGLLLLVSALVLLAGLESQLSKPSISLLEQLVFDGAGLGAVLILVFGRRHAAAAALGYRLPRRLRWFAAVPLFLVAAYATALVLSLVTERLLPQATSSQCPDVQAQYGTSYAIAFIAVCIAAPVAEETFFRGFLYGWLRTKVPVWAAVVISAVAFGLVHNQSALFLALAGVGAILALCYEMTGSLLPGMLVHGCFNAVNLYFILYGHC